MDYVIQNWKDLVEITFAVVGVASLVVKLTPTDIDNKVVDSIIAILGALALNPKDK